MHIADNIIKKRISNVYFIWGRGKTTITSGLRSRYGCYVYDTDESRQRHLSNADTAYQPHMLRDYEKEYGVSDFWELSPEIINEREKHWLREFTPMVIMELVLLAPLHEIILCEGDIDYGAVLPVASHMVHLSNLGTQFDWFQRPDHIHMLDSIKNRTDISEADKDLIIKNAYNAVGMNETPLPDWVTSHGVKNIAWDDNTAVEQTISDVAEYFGFCCKCS